MTQGITHRTVPCDNGEVLVSTRQEYNANNQLVGQHWTVGSTTYSETYTYSTVDGAMTSYNNALGQTISLEYDALRRISRVDTTTLDRFFEYADGKESGQTTGLVSRYWYTTANYDDAYFKYSYSYDALGNISSYTQSGTTYTYTYDDQNQLKTQTGGGKTYTYTYDNTGNILTASSGTTTNSYTYGNALWRDQLTAFNGQTITYDCSGNPLSYYNGKRYTFTWEEGRNLVSAVEGTNTYTYAYDSSGLRISKTVNGVTHNYLYASGKLLRETYGSTTLDFVYGQGGHPYALIFNNGTTTQTYYYITNLQGDVLYLLDSDKQVVASYTYDPYGKPLDSAVDGTIAAINPLRYRGYYYDVETGFYYLQSRYYDPAACRFINFDSYVGTGQGFLGYNMLAYCRNNPISRADFAGTLDMDQCDDDRNPLDNDISNYTGAGFWNSFSQTVHYASMGLNMAAGGRSFSGAHPVFYACGHKISTNNYAGDNEKTNVHHVVEQCQGQKSGFSNSQIQADSNKVVVDYELHKSISGFYSSIQEFTQGLRVRNWLAGQSFETQTTFGWKVVNYFYDLLGK